MRFLIFLLLALSPVCRAEVLQLRSGEDINAEVVSADADSVELAGGKTLPRRSVFEIQFAGRADEKTAAPQAQVSEQDKRDAAEAWKQAREFGARYCGMNGLILLDSGAEILNPDGTRIRRNHQVRQILKESLKQHWGQVTACAEEGRSRVKIVKASVYSPDGSVYPLDASRIKISRPQDASSQFFVSGEICSQYAMPGVQVGSIVDYETEEEEYNPFRKDFFFPHWGFQDTEGPVRVSEISITLPDKQDFYYAVRNFRDAASAGPEIIRSGKTKTYVWRLENVPPLANEPQMPAYEDVAPFMRGSLLKDWGPVFGWLEKLYAERTQPSPELKKFTLELIKGCKTDAEKAAKIYHYVQKEIRYIAVKVGVASGWGGYDANLTWKRRWGCCVDKSLLLTAMLRVAGIKASPILINTNDRQEMDFRIPQLGFDHSITVADIGGKHVFLDSTNYDYRYPEIAGFDYGVNVLNVFAGKIDFVPPPAPKDNGNFYDYSITLSTADAAVVSRTMRYSGSREGEVRGYYRSLKKEEQKQAFERLAKLAAATAQLLDYQVNNAENVAEPFSLSMKYSAGDFAKRAGDIVILKLPDFEMEAFRIEEISQVRREHPIKYETPSGRYWRYRLAAPANYEAVSLPEKISLSGKYGSFKARCKKEGRGGVDCSASLERPALKIPAADYEDYKAFLEKAAAYTKTQLLFKEKK